MRKSKILPILLLASTLLMVSYAPLSTPVSAVRTYEMFVSDIHPWKDTSPWFGYNVKFRVTIKARKTWLSEPTYIEVDDAKVHIDYKQVRDDGWTKTGSMSDVTDSDGEVIFNFYFDWDIDMDYIKITVTDVEDPPGYEINFYYNPDSNLETTEIWYD